MMLSRHGMFNFERFSRDARVLKALIGMELREFDHLLITFTRILEQQALSQPRQRAMGGGCKGVLDTPAKKLFLVLFYLKAYPTPCCLINRAHYKFSDGTGALPHN